MILAADFGGTTIKLGLVHEGHVLSRARLDVETGRTMLDQLEASVGIWEELLHKGDYSLKDCFGVGLALPFLTDPSKSRVWGEFEKFPGASEIDYGAWCRRRLGLPLVLENDLRMALLGEQTTGAARGKSDVVMLAFGTGIGCAVISAGQFLRGANNRATILLGHSTVSQENYLGRCGNVGCAEDLASTATLEKRALERSDFAGSTLAGEKKIDFETVFALASRGDACSQALMQESLRIWATLALNVVLAFDPEVLVLGGGILRSGEIVLGFVADHLRRHMPCFPLQIPVVTAELGDDAALLGAEIFFNQTGQRLKQ